VEPQRTRAAPHAGVAYIHPPPLTPLRPALVYRSRPRSTPTAGDTGLALTPSCPHAPLAPRHRAHPRRASWTAVLAVLSTFEAGVLALVRYQVLRELDGGEVDDECGWNEEDEMKLDLM
jgi:hypothetical protein